MKSKRKTILGAVLFCGGGGTSQGMVIAANKMNADLDMVAVNHWQVAIDTHALNHPQALNLCTGVDVVDPLKIVPGGRLDLLCASPECTHHSNARGGRPRSEQSRASAFHISRWAQVLYIKAMIIENVPEFESWGPLGADGKPMKSKRGALFNQFIDTLKALGYKVEWRVLNCADYGAPTTRRRLFIICRRDGAPIRWPEPTHHAPGLAARGRQWIPARKVINLSDVGEDISTRKVPLVPATLRRIEIGIKRFCGVRPEPFLVILRGTGTARSLDVPLPTITAGGTHIALVQFLVQYYGNSAAASLDSPLPTITTKDRFGLLTCDGNRHSIHFRMLRNDELALGSGFPGNYRFTGTKTEITKQIGNAVPPPASAALCQAVLQ